MADDGWCVPVAKKGRNRPYSKQQKKVYVNPSDLLKSIDDENAIFDQLSEEEKVRRTNGSFESIVSKACDIAKTSFFADTLVSYHAAHPTLASICQQELPTERTPPLPKWKSRVLNAMAASSSTSMSACAQPVLRFASCLGIGPFLRSPAALNQLSLFILLCLHSSIDLSYCEVYDPILTSTERFILIHFFGLRVPEANTEGTSPVSELITKYSQENPASPSANDLPVLFYLPHCGVGLASNVLKANWTMLQDIILIGNSATRTIDLCYFPPVDTALLSSTPFPAAAEAATSCPASEGEAASHASDHANAGTNTHSNGGAGTEADGDAHIGTVTSGDVTAQSVSPRALAALSPNNAYLSSLLHTQRATPHAWVGVARALPWTAERPLPAHAVQGAFNDTAIHTFTAVPAQLLLAPPPLYQVPVQVRDGEVLTANPEIIPAAMRPR